MSAPSPSPRRERRRTDAAGPATDPHRVLSPREQRIAALESVVNKQHEALQQANETIRQMREEFQQVGLRRACVSASGITFRYNDSRPIR